MGGISDRVINVVDLYNRHVARLLIIEESRGGVKRFEVNSQEELSIKQP